MASLRAHAGGLAGTEQDAVHAASDDPRGVVFLLPEELGCRVPLHGAGES